MSDQIITVLADLVEPDEVASDAPKLRVPFDIVTGSDGTAAAAVVPQDSQAELAQTVYAICATPVGTRDDVPELGVPNLEFSKGGVDLDAIRTAVEEAEPRAAVVFDSQLEGVFERISAAVAVSE